MNNPQLTPYKFPQEAEKLYKDFFHSRYSDQKAQAISKVRSYLTKGPIPHSVEITALLTEAILEDEKKTGVRLSTYEKSYPRVTSISNMSDLSIRLQYSMCIIKFVNGLLDPFQQSVYNISLHKLAIELNLPNYFVETRHVSTHERLPSLEMMRLVAQRALNWIKAEYWEKAIGQYREQGALDVNLDQWTECIKSERKTRIKRENDAKRNENFTSVSEADIKEVEYILKNIKKIRKDELQKGRKVKELNTEIGKLNTLIATKPNEFTIQLLVFKNYLVLHGEKNENLNEKKMLGLRKMWGEVVEQLEPDYCFKLWTFMFKLATMKTFAKYDQNYVESKLLANQKIEYLQDGREYTQVVGWLTDMLANNSFVNNTNIESLLSLLMISSDISKKCLLITKQKYHNLLTECGLIERVEKLENIMTKFWVIDDNFAEKEIQDIDHDASNYVQNKRVKPSLYLFKTFPSWRPVPFGCPP
ncbi:hypothetical protein PMKS-002234 [Pichia membranifaciens]|uniref:Las1p n=1 Tax=Pichia membranifaciens TaxID=4926 RepID=A0A1Q2YGT8_9ASCO|nr:hypothetical protein PMKS-002234 [Pichia membranifaciens]